MCSQQKEGKRKHFEKKQSFLFLTRSDLKRNYFTGISTMGFLSRPNQPGGGGKYLTPAHGSHLVPLKVGEKYRRVHGKFRVQRHMLTKRLKSNYKTIELLPSPTY